MIIELRKGMVCGIIVIIEDELRFQRLEEQDSELSGLFRYPLRMLSPGYSAATRPSLKTLLAKSEYVIVGIDLRFNEVENRTSVTSEFSL